MLINLVIIVVPGDIVEIRPLYPNLGTIHLISPQLCIRSLSLGSSAVDGFWIKKYAQSVINA